MNENLKINNLKVNKIHNSTENLKVSYLMFNRPRSRSHILKISKSIKKHGWFGTVIMIDTNLYSKKSQLYVIDGQHRMDAANLLGCQYRYEIVNVTNQEEVVTLMADLNNNSKGWTLQDYLAPWISLGHASYKELLRTLQETKLPLASLIRLLSGSTFGGETGGASTDAYKRGAFMINKPNRPFADKVIEEVLAIKKAGFKVGDPFIMAFAGFYQKKANRYKRDSLMETLKSNRKEFSLADKSTDIKELLLKYYQ